MRRGLAQAAHFAGSRRSLVASAAGGLALLGVLGTALLRDLQAEVAGETAVAQRTLDTVTEVGGHALELAVRGADLLLIDLRDEWQWHRGRFAQLVATRQRHPAIGFDFDITVLDRDGRVIFSTMAVQGPGTDLSELPLFPRLRGAAGDTLSISAVRSPGERPVMELARRLVAPPGEFDGVVICSVPTDYLRSQFSGVELEAGTTFTGLRRDGRVLVQLTSRGAGVPADTSPTSRTSWPLPLYGLSRRASLAEAAEASAGGAQLIAWREAHAYPFTFVVARPRAGLDAKLSALRWRYAALAAVLSAGLLAGVWRLLRRQEARERAAREQAQHLQALTRARSALAASEGELRRLSSHQLAAKEAEHRRLAQEIHDELGQRLTVHRMDLALLPQAVRDDPARELPIRVAAMKADVDAMLRIARDIAGQLRPGALDVGLAAAVESMLHEVNGKLGIRCEFENRLPPAFTTDDTRATTAFRIVQEAVTNAVSHAGPSRIRVVLDRSQDKLLLRIEDDGSGFDQHAQASGFGLKGMRQRTQALGGDLRIGSATGQGTTVEAEFPLHGEIESGMRVGAPDAGAGGQ